MRLAFRASWYALALSFSLIGSAFAQVQVSASGLNSSQSPAESAVRAVVEKYFTLYANKDVDALLGLWSEKSPDYVSLKQNWQRQFATEDYRLSPPRISRVKVEEGKASLRATVDLTATDLKNNQKREQQMVRNFALVSEEGRWKVWRYVEAENDLANALVNAGTEAERAGLLADEKDLVTSALVRAVAGQGDRSYGKGDFQQAQTIYRLANSLADQIGDKPLTARTLLNLGNVHRSQGNYAQAFEYVQKSKATYEALGDKSGTAETMNSIGTIHLLQSNHPQALEYYQKSLAIVETLGNKTGIARRLSNIGIVYWMQGDYPRALDYFQKGLVMFESLGDKSGISGGLNNIGAILDQQGNYALALENYQKSLAIHEALGDKAGIAGLLGNIGTVYHEQGNYPLALEYYQKSLALRESIGDKAGIASSLHDIGRVHQIQGSYPQALEYFQKSLGIRDSLGDKIGLASTLNNIGLIHRLQGEYAQALEYHQKSLAVRESIGDRPGIAITLNNIGEVQQRQGHYSQALETASRAAALAGQIGHIDALWKARLAAGTAYMALNQPAQARPAFEEAITIIETLRTNVAGGGEERQRFFESKVSAYHAMVDLLTAEGRPAEALTFAERAKARVLVDVLQTGRVNVTKAMTSQEQQQERNLNSQLVSLNTQISREATRARPDQARLTELKPQLEKARLDFEAFKTNLYAAHPELRAFRGEAQPLRLEEATSLLADAKSALLEYVVAGDKTYLFVITKAAGKVEAEVHAYTLPFKRDELTRQTEGFRQQLAGRDLGFRASALKLYALLLKPAESQLKGKTNLIIVPDDKLWDLPFQALLTRANRFLIEDAAVTYAPSLTVLREIRKRPKNEDARAASATLLALGNPLLGKETVERATLALRDEKLDPLPEAEQEVKALGQLYSPARSKVYVGAEAREDRVKNEAERASILHFATHGTLNNASPMYSHLVLAPGDKNEDGLLEAWELMQMDLKADLAVLSACETARGRYGAGEGIIGLTWAMFVAGVPSTVVSQWKVESAGTRDLMVNFHRGLISQPGAGKAKPTKTEALRQAAMKLMRNPETSHPFYWAGFVLIGDGR
ncbi:MAG TPA: tetratricopeptide repeat protein [Blastocatellia bacterium]|nr:tetratricopeptide repeat protein [Blastocatellia bacterium]